MATITSWSLPNSPGLLELPIKQPALGMVSQPILAALKPLGVLGESPVQLWTLKRLQLFLFCCCSSFLFWQLPGVVFGAPDMKDKLSIIELQSQPLKGFRRALEAWKGLRVGLKEWDKKKKKEQETLAQPQIQATKGFQRRDTKSNASHQRARGGREQTLRELMKPQRSARVEVCTRASAGHYMFLYGFPLRCLGITFLSEPEACHFSAAAWPESSWGPT